VVPATLAIIFLLLYMNFHNVVETLIVMLSLLGYNWSVATAIGFIALGGRGGGDGCGHAHVSGPFLEGEH
jgi:Cu/Ag efflux pump CusA